LSSDAAADAAGTHAAPGGREPHHHGHPVSDRFFRQLLQSVRNGVLAVTPDGRLAVMNEVAFRILDLEPRSDAVGQPYADVLSDRPEVVRILGSAFEVAHLPNRAELRLQPSDKVIGYTLSHIHDDGGQVLGAALFFKDLTLVEQQEERERLRDRLAALGEMAATIAHEVKNPLAGIEVMAGLLRRRLADSEEGQALVNDIIGEAKKANAIVQEVLEFVRPLRLQVERTSSAGPPRRRHDGRAQGQPPRRRGHAECPGAASSPRAITSSCASLRQPRPTRSKRWPGRARLR
jgi:nitrogen-specific signal transduction histidine kinase